MSTRALAKKCSADRRTEDAQALLDQMLLCLHDALHLNMALKWSTAGVSNLSVDEAPDLRFN